MLRVLLLEDDPLQLQTRKAILEAAGFIVSAAQTAEEARSCLLEAGADTFQVVVTDHLLPQSSGVAFVRHLRSHYPNLPIIVVTGLAEAESQYHELNVVFLQKPSSPGDLVRAVKKAVPPDSKGLPRP